jgi:hypothetical protein
MFTPKLTLLLPSMLLCLGSQNVSAGPMGFKDAYMVMGDFNNNWREAFINYAITPRDAFGVSATYMRSDDKTRTRTLEEVTYTKLFHRWNMPHAQANLWLLGGIGALQAENARIGSDDKFDNIMITPGVQFDYETTRVYFQATHRLYRASGINHDYNSVRAGFSFYETDYDKTQPWLIVEARNMNGLSDKVEITPMLRLINKSFFLEAGVNNFAQPRFNFMYLF